MKFLRRIYKKILAFIDTPSKLVGLFTVVMLAPNLTLAYTEPYTITTIMALMLMPAGFYLMFVSVARRPGIMMLWAFPLMFLGAFQIVLSYLFGNSIIAVDMFINVITTNASEAGELLGNIFPAVVLVCVIYVPLIIIAIRSVMLDKRLLKQQRWRGVVAGAILMVVGGGFAGISNYRNSDFAVKYHIFPINVCYNIKLTVERSKICAAFLETSKDFTFDATKKMDSTRREVYVFVIGEASRASSWSMFGYDRDTNPMLKDIEHIALFRDVITQSNTTHKSVPIMLSSVSAEDYDDIYERKSVITLFKEAGFRTCFISNQSANRSLIDDMIVESDTIINVTKHDAGLGGLVVNYEYDGEIIPHLHNLLNDTDENLFIVIHTYGSHASVMKRYPRSFAHFTPDQVLSVNRKTRPMLINAYDNSIRYTDHTLAQMIAALDSVNAISTLLYCSDHGEDLMDDKRNRFLHASPTTTYYQLHVPAFAWFSQSYIDQFPQKYITAQDNALSPASTASLFHTLADMASIESDYVKLEESLVNRDRVELPRMYLNDHNKAINILATGLNEADVDMMEDNNLSIDRKEFTKKRY